MIRRLVLNIMLGLVLGACVHIVVVLLVPRLGHSSAFQRLVAAVPMGRTVTLGGEAAPAAPRFPDPSVAISACPFDLTEGPFRISVVTRDLVQSLSIHSETGGVLYAVSDRSAIRGGITFTLMTRRQLEIVQAREEEEPVNETRLALDVVRGLVVVRAHAPFDSQREQARALVSSLSCRPAG